MKSDWLDEPWLTDPSVQAALDRLRDEFRAFGIPCPDDWAVSPMDGAGHVRALCRAMVIWCLDNA